MRYKEAIFCLGLTRNFTAMSEFCLCLPFHCITTIDFSLGMQLSEPGGKLESVGSYHTCIPLKPRKNARLTGYLTNRPNPWGLRGHKQEYTPVGNVCQPVMDTTDPNGWTRKWVRTDPKSSRFWGSMWWRADLEEGEERSSNRCLERKPFSLHNAGKHTVIGPPAPQMPQKNPPHSCQGQIWLSLQSYFFFQLYWAIACLPSLHQLMGLLELLCSVNSQWPNPELSPLYGQACVNSAHIQVLEESCADHWWRVIDHFTHVCFKTRADDQLHSQLQAVTRDCLFFFSFHDLQEEATTLFKVSLLPSAHGS